MIIFQVFRQGVQLGRQAHPLTLAPSQTRVSLNDASTSQPLILDLAAVPTLEHDISICRKRGRLDFLSIATLIMLPLLGEFLI